MSSKENCAITAVLFDMDNTLIATREVDALTCNKVSFWCFCSFLKVMLRDVCRC